MSEYLVLKRSSNNNFLVRSDIASMPSRNVTFEIYFKKECIFTLYSESDGYRSFYSEMKNILKKSCIMSKNHNTKPLFSFSKNNQKEDKTFPEFNISDDKLYPHIEEFKCFIRDFIKVIYSDRVLEHFIKINKPEKVASYLKFFTSHEELYEDKFFNNFFQFIKRENLIKHFFAYQYPDKTLLGCIMENISKENKIKLLNFSFKEIKHNPSLKKEAVIFYIYTLNSLYYSKHKEMIFKDTVNKINEFEDELKYASIIENEKSLNVLEHLIMNKRFFIHNYLKDFLTDYSFSLSKLYFQKINVDEVIEKIIKRDVFELKVCVENILDIFENNDTFIDFNYISKNNIEYIENNKTLFNIFMEKKSTNFKTFYKEYKKNIEKMNEIEENKNPKKRKIRLIESC